LVCCGEPWLSQAVLGGVVTCLAGKCLPVAGVVAGFVLGDCGWVAWWPGWGWLAGEVVLVYGWGVAWFGGCHWFSGVEGTGHHATHT